MCLCLFTKFVLCMNIHKEPNRSINKYCSPYVSERVKGMDDDQRKIHRRD